MILLLLFWTSFQETPERLRYTFLPGNEATLSHQVNATIRSGQSEMTVCTDYGYDLRVEFVYRGAAIVRVEPTFFQSEIATEAGTIKFDSKGDTSVIQNRVAAALMGNPFYVTITDTGGVTSVDGLRRAHEAIASLELDDYTTGEISRALATAYSDDVIRSVFDDLFMRYPDVEASAGNSWADTLAVRTSFPVDVARRWGVRESAGEVARLEEDGVVLSRADSAAFPGAGRVPTRSEGFRYGYRLVNRQTGWPLRTEVYSTITAEPAVRQGATASRQRLEIEWTARTVIGLR